MSVSPGFKLFVLEQLESISSIASKSMFGGVGLYADGHFFAILAEDRLYFKVDESNQPDFEAAGMAPFKPFDDERTMKYWEVPVDVLEDVDALREWTQKAVDVAKRAKKPKKRKK